ncbi:hypothetical protein [Anatilimnocola aggregata]|uniref:hypothetical protein n=1 Tax=Anatilimnocola aggregata TaxID=2528021 RepID=UPI0011A279C7|nr:hypothetical protein [Anatilimnocola aggregata]
MAKLRKLEPTGLLNSARVQIHLQQTEAASATIKQLESIDWPLRFRVDLQKQLPELKKVPAK